MDRAALDSRAREILRTNDRGGYTVPTAGLYPYQWNWDSGFAAWGWAQVDIARAWAELETLMLGQWDNGMLPHMVFHRDAGAYHLGADFWGNDHSPPTSGITQPPVIASFARRIYEADPAAGQGPVARLFPGLMAWHRWFFAARVEDGMVAITHPWESGRDNAADWDAPMQAVDGAKAGPYRRADTSHVDAAMRPSKEDYDRYVALVRFSRETGWDEAEIARNGPFRVADPGMTFILLRACRDLAVLAAVLGQPAAEIEGWIAALEAGAARHWNPERGHYDSLDLRSGRFCGVLGSAAFLCWYAGVDDDRMIAPLERVLGAVRFGVPSNDPAAPSYDPIRYWRGPVWANVNALIGLGLAETGHRRLAARLRDDTARLIAGHGFNEYYSPEDGAPAGGGAFSWTAAVWLAWASPSAGAGI